MIKKIYLILAVLGLAIPYYFFISFLIENGLDISLLVNQLFANDISTFFAVDLLITAVVLIIFIIKEGQRYKMRNAFLYILATLLIGPSFAFPLFLYFREGNLHETTSIS